jgi:hypothetical protein
VTNPAVRYAGQLVLNTPNYPLVPHGFLPENEICDDNHEEDNYFTMSHRYTLGSKGHFWFLQVGLKYEGENDSKKTLLLGLSALMEILLSAINRFELHPLDETSSCPALTNNRVEDGFPSSAILAFKYCGMKNKQCPQGLSQKLAPSQPSPHQHNDEGVQTLPILMGGHLHPQHQQYQGCL